MTLTRTRLFGVLAHVDAGKTTVSERMLYFSGRIHRMGEVHHGSATLDHTDEERNHGITISAAATTTTWRSHVLSLIDTPGHIDFAIEVERSLRVLDGAVVVLDAARGVEPQTEAVWQKVEQHGVPRVIFINKLDAPGASVDACLNALRNRLGANPVLLQTLREDGSLVDLVEERALHFAADGALQVVLASEPAARQRLIEAVAECDAQLLELWVREGDVSATALRAGLRRATIGRKLVPVVCGAALRNRGVQPLLDAVVDYLPSPLDRALPHGLTASMGSPACGFVFKTELAPHVGALAWVRVFQGRLRAGDVVEVGGSRTERVARVLGLHGGSFEPLEALGPGGIAAIVGLKSARTGDTLCAPGLRVELDPISTADAVVELALEAKNSDDQARLTEALRKACFEDPSLRLRVAESGQTVLCGVGELHLSIWLEKLARRERLVVNTGAPRVALRDTLQREATVTYRHVRQTGGPGQFAVVTLCVTPRGRGEGFNFVDHLRGGSIPAQFVAAIEAGARGALDRGVREGVPVVDVEVQLLDGETHVRDSSAMAFELAASVAVQKAALEAGLMRLEPVTALQVTTPEESLGAVLGELASRRAAVNGVSVELALATVHASLPLARSFGFVTALRNRTEGRGAVTMSAAGYRSVD